jgi:type II secretory pathway component PulF
MDTFNYIVLDRKGKKLTGELEGEDLNKIKKTLRDKGFYVIRVYHGGKSRSVFTRGIKETDLVVAIRELSTFVNSKLPLDECLTGVTAQMKNSNLKKIFQGIQRKIREGKSFSDALSDFPQLFSEMMVSMIKVGEETGTLDLILLRVANFMERRQAFKTKITGIMTYPLFMLVVAVAVLIFILTFVTPTITQIFSEISLNLPVPTRMLIEASSFLKSFWLYLILGMIFVYLGAKRGLYTPKGEKVKDFFRLKLPFFNDLFIKREIISFSSTLSTLLKGGVDIIEALRTAGRVLTSNTLKEEINEVIKFVSKGGALSDAFKRSRYFPYLVIQLVSAGERSGTLAEMFDKIGDIYEAEVTNRSTRFVTFIEPMMILFMGVVVGLIVLAVLLPIFQISQAIK